MSVNNNKTANALINESSPYLQQHSYNPVQWLPWSNEAFERARAEDKPVFLSVGYSTCHWCHVMAHESFEDPKIAELMNKHFINIKVDREERPDVDNIYMQACNLLTGGGGWPLTVIMTPDRTPFFAGTYFPRDSVMGRAGMSELVPRIAEVWKERRGDIESSGRDIMVKLHQMNANSSGDVPGSVSSEQAFQTFDRIFDKQYGGFGGNPKFPVPHQLTFLLRYHSRTGNSRALEMARKSLTEMRKGGIYDHVGFGFHRYSTDSKWFLPHFEKMLYDQAMLMIAFTELWQLTRDKSARTTIDEIAEYVARDLTGPEGMFYSAEDADSEGSEGRFYIWTANELKNILDSDYVFISDYFSVKDEGNITEHSEDEFYKQNILHINNGPELLSKHYEITGNKAADIVNRSLGKLHKVRSQRPRPHLDNKALTDWNGLMIWALAYAGRATGQTQLLQYAEKSTRHIMENNTPDELKHMYINGKWSINAKLNDYVFLAYGLTELFMATNAPEYLKYAIALTDNITERFADSNGGFFMADENEKDLIIRRKEIYDSAEPSGNSMAIMLYTRLWKLTGRNGYRDMALKTLKAFAGTVAEYPFSYTQYMCAVEDMLSGGSETIVVGAGAVSRIAQEINREYLPGNVIISVNDNNREALQKLIPYISEYKPGQDGPAIYVCREFTCQAPVYTAGEAVELLKKGN